MAVTLLPSLFNIAAFCGRNASFPLCLILRRSATATLLPSLFNTEAFGGRNASFSPCLILRRSVAATLLFLSVLTLTIKSVNMVINATASINYDGVCHNKYHLMHALM